MRDRVLAVLPLSPSRQFLRGIAGDIYFIVFLCLSNFLHVTIHKQKNNKDYKTLQSKNFLVLSESLKA